MLRKHIKSLSLCIKTIFDKTSKEKWQKKKIDKLEFNKVKDFSATNDSIKKVKRQSTNIGVNIWKSYIW